MFEIVDRTCLPPGLRSAAKCVGHWRIGAWLFGMLSPQIWTALCMAQATNEPTPTGKSWVMAYFVFGLGIALGLVVLCRPGNRSQQFRQQPHE